MSKFAVLASPPSSRSSSTEREEDVGREVEEEVEEQGPNQKQSETKNIVRPEQKVIEKDSDTISLNLGSDNWSPIHRINGYPWRVHLYCKDTEYFVEVHCDKTTEAEFWQCTAKIELTSPYYKTMEVEFNRWKPQVLISSSGDKQWIKLENERNRTMRSGWWPDRLSHDVKITPKEDGNRWARRQMLNPSEPFDGVIKIGEEQKEIQVHREFLAAHSPLFLKEFFENYKETNITEISITDVDSDVFASMIRILYAVHSVSPHCQNFLDLNSADIDARKILELAQKYQLKTVENRCISFLLSDECSIPIHERLVKSEELNLQILTEYLLKKYKRSDIVSLSNSNEFDELSPESLKVLFNKGSVDESGNVNIRPLAPVERIARDPSANNESNKIKFETNGISVGTESPVKHIHGYPWHLRVGEMRIPFRRYTFSSQEAVYLICDKSSEAELWKCTATISSKTGNRSDTRTFFFSSWDKSSHKQPIFSMPSPFLMTSEELSRFEAEFEVTIMTEEDGKIYTHRPTLDPLEAKDGILVFEKEKKKIEVNKQSLADYSAYFHILFFGNYMEKTMAEIPIGDIKFKEFSNIMALLYGSDKAHFHCKNAERMLQLAVRLDLKILEDRAVALLLSPSSAAIPMPKKLLIADQYLLYFLTDGLISQLKSAEQLREVGESDEWNDLDKRTHRLLFQKFCI